MAPYTESFISNLCIWEANVKMLPLRVRAYKTAFLLLPSVH